MSYYTVRRDDAEIRVAVCPKCKSADITKTNDVIPYKVAGYLLKLCQCNSCHVYFSFDREDGMKEITQELAERALKKQSGSYGCCDMKANGKDQHGHSYYVFFKSKPPTISNDKYDDLLGFTEGHEERDRDFDKFLEALPSLNTLIRYRDIINNLDFENMTYLTEGIHSKFEKFSDAALEKVEA
jgi:hypothetical protein